MSLNLESAGLKTSSPKRKIDDVPTELQEEEVTMSIHAQNCSDMSVETSKDNFELGSKWDQEGGL